jgi:hypothetical protein
MMASGDDGVAEGTMQTTTKIVVRHSRRVGRKTTRGEDLEQSHRSASKKNLIRSLAVQDHKSKRFRKHALPFADAR